MGSRRESAAIADTAASGSSTVRRWYSLASAAGPPRHEGPIRGVLLSQQRRHRGPAPFQRTWGIALLDVDYHGNGTQDIYERDDVRFIHGDPAEEPPLLGPRRRARRRSGRRTQCKFSHSQRHGGRDVVRHARPGDRLAGTSSPALVVSLGLDTFVEDPFHFRLQQPDFMRLGQRLAAIELPTVLVMEGGYATEELGRNVAAVPPASRPVEAIADDVGQRSKEPVVLGRCPDDPDAFPANGRVTTDAQVPHRSRRSGRRVPDTRSWPASERAASRPPEADSSLAH